MRRRGRLVALLSSVGLVAGLALTGCSSSAQDSSSGAAEAPAGRDLLANPEAVTAQGRQPLARDPDAPAEPEAGQRALIYTGSITVRVDDVDKAAANATSIATAAGGFVGGDERASDASASSASLTLRVPGAKFATVVDKLAALGEPQQRNLKTDDVTEEIVDLDARIATQRARVESGRRLLSQAKSLSDLVMLEGELAKREADLASLEAKKRQLADLTALSTITAVLLGPDAPDSHDEPQLGFLVGLKGGWNAFLVSLRVLLTVLGALLPWIVAVAVPVVGVLWLVRRLRGRRPAPPGQP